MTDCSRRFVTCIVLGWGILKNRYLFWFCVSFVITTQLSAYCTNTLTFLCVLITVASLTVLALSKNGFKVAAVLVVAAMCLSVIWHNFYVESKKFPRELLHSKDEMTFEVLSYSERTSNGKGIGVTAGFKSGEEKYRAKLYVSDTQIKLLPGDFISLTPHFSELRNAESFAEETYYKARYIDAICFADDITLLPENKRGSIKYLPQFLAEKFKSKTEELFGEEAASFLKALILSDKDGLSEQTERDLRATGLSHTVSVSGFHISFIVGLLLLITKNRYLKLLFIPIIFLFAFMVGAPSSALRAVIMQTLLIISAIEKREYDSLTSLSFAGFVLVVINPYCATDLGFILSFLSSFGIIFLHNKLMGIFRPLLDKFSGKGKRTVYGLLSVLSVSLSATIFTAPILAYSFNYISLISPISNTVLNPFITLVFSLGIIVILLGFVYFPLARALAFILEAIIGVVMNTIRAMAKIPFSEVVVNNPSVVIFICLICLILIYSIYVGSKKIRPAVTALTVAVSLATLFVSFVVGYRDTGKEGFRVDVLDVGQGQCIVITKEDACAVVDCGGDKDAGSIAISHILKNGISDIDALVLTHGHADHTNGARSLVKTVATDKIYMPAADRENAQFIKICEDASDDCETVFLEESARVDVDGIDLEILTLPEANSEQENGLVIIVHDGEYELLITGDIPATCEKLILDKLPDCESYIVGHHGSKSSSSQALLNKALPELCVVSVGIDNGYGHPSPDTLTRIDGIGATVARTDISGTLTFYSREDRKQNDDQGIQD